MTIRDLVFSLEKDIYIIATIVNTKAQEQRRGEGKNNGWMEKTAAKVSFGHDMHATLVNS